MKYLNILDIWLASLCTMINVICIYCGMFFFHNSPPPLSPLCPILLQHYHDDATLSSPLPLTIFHVTPPPLFLHNILSSFHCLSTTPSFTANRSIIPHPSIYPFLDCCLPNSPGFLSFSHTQYRSLSLWC